MEEIKKGLRILAVLIIVSILIVAPKKSIFAESDPVIPEPAYYVHSDHPALKALLGVHHQFDGVFSTELSSTKLEFLKHLGVEAERVQIYTIFAKPFAKPSPTPGGRKCYPTNQYPWGVVKVNGGLGGAGLKVAVLDTGVDSDHPDLKGNIVSCVSKATHLPQDRRSCEDANGHGTHVSGTILASGGSDGKGIYGVAPAASLITVKVCDRRGYCYGDDIAAGIRFAADQGANVVNMSFGGNTPDPQILNATDYAIDRGLLVIAAGGNDGPADGSIDYPAAYVKVISVGAIDASENVPNFSSRGLNNGDYVREEREIEFAAPGVYVESTYNNGCYTSMSGTSMATPHVTGLAAKLWQGTAAGTRSYLQQIAKDIWTVGDDTATGFGLPIVP